MEKHTPSQDTGSVALIAASGSALADRLTQEITKLGAKIIFVPLGTSPGGDIAATVFVIEHGPAIEGLRTALDSVEGATLVAASPSEPAANLRPLVETPLQRALGRGPLAASRGPGCRRKRRKPWNRRAGTPSTR